MKSRLVSSKFSLYCNLSDFVGEEVSELVSHEKIEDRVYDTVQEGQRSGQNVQCLYVHDGTLRQLRPGRLRCNPDVS